MKSKAINILFAAVLVTCFSFALKQHHSPHQSKAVYRVYFAGKLSGSSVSKKEAADASAIVVKDEAGDNYQVKRFRMFLKRQKGSQEADAVGANFTALQKEYFSDAESGARIIFDNIYFTGTSGREIKIDSASYTLK